jgi:hypothetical protein
MAQRYGAEMTVPDWHARLVCSQCGSRRVDFVVTGTERALITVLYASLRYSLIPEGTERL